MNAYWGIAGIVISFMSLVVALNGVFDNPYINAALMLLAIAGAFLFGYNAHAAKDRLNALVNEKLEKAASKAVDDRLDDINEMVSGGVFDEINASIRALTEDIGRGNRANEVLSELSGFITDEGRKAYILANGKMDPGDFRERMALLVERGDVTGVALNSESGAFEFTSEIGIIDKSLRRDLERVGELHELHMVDERALRGNA